ncbi:MAG: hypothetical protein HOV77_14535 [Hamadaea sp.]|uniref:hypothetical protein n=1 Tax=Hamadaea sp. TaxID=2024425 RepID=UPI00179E206B|nr:hypothetical protein [Hamadaea sp.]NUT20400.1 hypothetical protein [Hamadaea sp.]
MSKVTCVVCGHTEHGDSSYCMNPTCGELLPTAVRTPSQVDLLETSTEDAPPSPPPSEPPPVLPAPPVPPVPPVRRRSAVAAVSSARRWLLGLGAAVVLFALAVAFSRGTARPSPTTSPEALPRASVVAAMAPQVTLGKDERVAVTLMLTDHSEGKAAFYVVGGPIGRDPTTLADGQRGAATIRVYPLNPEVEYCFVVVAVLSVDEFAPSAQVCTNRFGTKKP